MASITFSNEQFKKIVELVYLGNWMKNSFHVPEEAEYDTPADDILDYLAMFAKEHGMKEFLTSSDKPTRSAKIDDMTSAAIDSYNADNMFEELIEQLTYRAFDEKHGRLPAFKGKHTSHEEQEEFNRIRAEFEMEFEQNGLRRVVVNRKMK